MSVLWALATSDLKVKAVVQVMARDSENSASEKVVAVDQLSLLIHEQVQGLGFKV